MRKWLYIVITAIIVAVGAWYWGGLALSKNVSSADVIHVIIGDNSVDCDKAAVKLGNFKPGDNFTVEVSWRNDTWDLIHPSLEYLYAPTPDDYSAIEGKGFMPAPPEAALWLTSPDITLLPKTTVTANVSLYVPKEAECPDKWAFKTRVRGNNGGFLQTAWAIWWLVDMR